MQEYRETEREIEKLQRKLHSLMQEMPRLYFIQGAGILLNGVHGRPFAADTYEECVAWAKANYPNHIAVKHHWLFSPNVGIADFYIDSVTPFQEKLWDEISTIREQSQWNYG